MKIDVTLEITPKMVQDAQGHDKKSLSGHLGTHFDVMNKEFPLEYTQRRGIVFDVSGIKDRDIGVFDVDLEKVPADELIEKLVDLHISLIGVDFAGIRRGREHPVKDQYCANHGVFVIENMCNLKELLNKDVIMNTYPMRYQGMTGLPCRVVAETM